MSKIHCKLLIKFSKKIQIWPPTYRISFFYITFLRNTINWLQCFISKLVVDSGIKHKENSSIPYALRRIPDPELTFSNKLILAVSTISVMQSFVCQVSIIGQLISHGEQQANKTIKNLRCTNNCDKVESHAFNNSQIPQNKQQTVLFFSLPWPSWYSIIVEVIPVFLR